MDSSVQSVVNMKYFVILSLLVTMGSSFPKFVKYQRTPLGDSVDKASMKILKESFKIAEDKNVIASPLGALTLLSMFSAGTEGQSREEIMKLLGSADYKTLQESYGNLTERFSSMDPSYFVLANKMYVSDKYTLNEQFSDIASRSYKSEVEQVDFVHKKATADRINKWADEKTKGHIKSPVDENTLDEEAAVALFNVLFFQGHWHVPFNAEETEERDFYVGESKTVSPLLTKSDVAETSIANSTEIKEKLILDVTRTVKKPMMKLQSSLFYHADEEIGAKMVELPYKETGFRMVIILPDKRDGLPEVVEKLAQKGVLEDVFALRPAGREVALEMPKFEIKSSLDLNDILPKVGVSRMFSEGARGVVREREVKVSKAFQEAFVKVDEEGATAGAFTGYILVPMSSDYEPPPPLPFKVDHPFMFVILHEDIVLFTGAYTH